MQFIRKIERLKKLNRLIEAERTGTPEELAAKLGLQKRALFEWVDYLKSYNLIIKYDRKRQTYFYKSNQNLDIIFSIKVLKDKDIKKVDGGYNLSLSAIFMHRTTLTWLV